MTSKTTEVQPTVDDTAKAEVATITDKALLAMWAERAVAIPAELDGGTEDILKKVLSATTWQQVDEPWRQTAIDDILGKHLRVLKVTRRPSSFAEGLGVFLIVKLADVRTGTEYVKTTGSIAVVGQFAQLYFIGATAITIEWCRAKRPSEGGFYPQHLNIIDAHVPERGTQG